MLLISAYCAAKITGVSHQRPALPGFLPQTKEISKEKENPVGTDPTYPKENG
jgi:hypothetical protein